MAIFDTNIIIDFLNGSPKAGAIVERYGGAENAGITSITGYELVKGLKEDKRDVFLSLLEKVKVYNLDIKSAWAAGELYKKLKHSGSLLSEADLLIISIVFTNGEVLITQDKKAFEKLNDNRIVIIE